MPPVSSLVGSGGGRMSLAPQLGSRVNNVRCVHPQRQCAVCALERRFSWKICHQLSRVGDRGPSHAIVVKPKPQLKLVYGGHTRYSHLVSPFGTYSSSSGRRAQRGNSDGLPGYEDEEKGGETEEEDSSPGLTARNLVGTYAASTALAVQESLPPEGVIVLLACLVGVLTGGSVVLFNLAVHGIHDEVWEGIPVSGAAWLRTRPLKETWLRLLAVPFGGGVLVGILNTMRQTLDDDENEKSKSRSKSSRLADFRGVFRAFLKAVSAAVTLGTGCSLGPEGPSVEIGASIANGVSAVLSNSRERKTALVAAGSAAGISSGFNAAVAGCFFAVESVLRPLSSDSAPSLTTAMLLLSSVVASVISQAGLGSDPAFKIPAYDFRSPAELPLYLLLGILSGGVSVTLVKGSAYATTFFENVKKTTGIPAGFLPPVGGLAVGVIALAYPEILYWGFENVDVLLESRPWARGPSVELLLQLVGVKVIATSLCRGSGLVGGMYAPSLFIGAALGSAYGNIARTLFSHVDPALHLEWIKVAAPQAYALVGMAAMLAGVCQVPLTSVLLLFELTRDYRIILPLMGAVGLSSWIASSSTKKSKRSKSESTLLSSSSAPITQSKLGSSPLDLSVASQQGRLSNGAGNGGLQTTTEKVQDPLALATERRTVIYTNDGSFEEFVEDKEVCNIDESLCLTNFEISEEQLADELPVSMAMRTSFASLSLGSTVREAMSVMVLEKEWCVLLLDSNQRLAGLLTLADIQQAAGNATAVNMQVERKPVSSLLKGKRLKQVVTATRDMSLRAAQRLMAGRGLRQVPVVDGSQRVIGLLDRDSIALACRAEATRRILGLSLSKTALEGPSEGL
ncbi:chloride channel protein CLC-e [Physcomitrium patens]|uniref:Chloride channel protein n=1 Tax=Physcomitrium patens TaxID=3218 RepID=A0A2K1JKQ9_PHYPA|nr:chloride channel protein CLC-e-like [Physcomitrium patens]XP_024392452.1 chloride channel protein CLC-e-like [Physcomitrium patens]XP_024392453.1 chloride channel protein CLC-e-like [Physcomitrium patens]XP_024392454.1 chloride channel protein CLC-e-like [Physcomitrium patens]PNR42138.1 hypothetical protein PHYPA_016967 [Physcomitrium patens]|eukprot:XP_024392451.1 chloride channel protein CLC-e-like [Physcomitrella patens]